MFINAINPFEGMLSPVMAGWVGVALIIIILLFYGKGMLAALLMKLHDFFIHHSPIRL